MAVPYPTSYRKKPTLAFHPEWRFGAQPPAGPKLPPVGGPPWKRQAGKSIDAEEPQEWLAKNKRAGATKRRDKGSMLAMMNKQGEAEEVAAADPPVREPQGTPIPGSRCVNVAASPCTALKSLGDFFRCKLATEVDKHAWAMTITAFLDFVAVRMKVEVHLDAAAGSHAVVIFQHTSQDDLVQFNHVCSLAVEHLSSSSLQVSEPGKARCPSPMLSDDDFDDDLFQCEEEWPEMLESAFEAVNGLNKSIREQGIQALARWAELKRECIPALADALIKHGFVVGELLKGPLAESYPLAVTVKFASRCPREAERLAEKLLPLLPWPNSVVPSLVARELEETFKNLITAGAASGKGTYQAVEDFEEPLDLFEDDDSPTSTCTGGPWSSGWSESSKSSAWESSRKISQGPQWARDCTQTLVLCEGEDDFTGDFI